MHKTTSEKALNQDLFPMKLYHKAKKLGVWNPADIDFSKDIEDWKKLTSTEKDLILRLTAMFQAGEESVTENILPLISAIASEKKLEDEMYLTTFLFEEAKHTEFFRRYLDEVAECKIDLTIYHDENYKEIFYDLLPATMNKLYTDKSSKSLLDASLTYNMIVEGVLAETGYHAYFSMLQRNNIMPGLREGIGLLKRDESRHIAYGVYLISNIVNKDRSLLNHFEERMNILLLVAINIINNIFTNYNIMPFDLKVDDFVDFAMNQYAKRLEKIEKASTGILAEEYE